MGCRPAGTAVRAPLPILWGAALWMSACGGEVPSSRPTHATGGQGGGGGTSNGGRGGTGAGPGDPADAARVAGGTGGTGGAGGARTVDAAAAPDTAPAGPPPDQELFDP